MSKNFKAQASSSRAAPAFGSPGGLGGFGLTAATTLSYLGEPPNLAPISDANVVVAFKNLSKKDSTTKAKGLEDFRAYVLAHPFELDGGVEQPVLEAWAKIYPRLSIDNSRRVRELAHVVQSDLLKSARKRFEKFIPPTVGAWIGGTYDRDRPVSKAAADGLHSFLDNDVKITAFWRKCQRQILEFVQEAIQETPSTLSDERTVNADDSQAKYDRVISMSLSLIINLFAKLSSDDIGKHQESYESLLVGNKTLWGFVASKNPYLRKTTAELLEVILTKQPSIIENDLKTIGNAFINEGLKARGIGSGLQYLKALYRLTTAFPTIWTMQYKSKTPVLSRLTTFVSKGSFASSPEYWIVLSSLILSLPEGVLPETISGCIDFLKAVHDGVMSKDEPKGNISTAWICYINIVKLLQDKLSYVETCDLLAEAVFPLFEAYIRPTPEAARWMTGNTTAALSKAFHLCVLTDEANFDSERSVKHEWNKLADMVIGDMQTSLPEQSKDFQKSQLAVVAEVHRWFTLQSEILNYSAPDRVEKSRFKKLLVDNSARIVDNALELLEVRNGKPFGAAAAVEGSLRLARSIMDDAPETLQAMLKFFGGHLPRLITSPSTSYLVAALKLYATLPEKFAVCLLLWDSAINELSTRPDTHEKAAAAEMLLQSRKAAPTGRQNENLQKLILEANRRSLQGEVDWRKVCETALTFAMYNDKTISQVFDDVIGALNDDRFENAVIAIEYIIGHRPEVLESDDTRRITIMTRLLAVGESGEPGRVSRAHVLRKAIGEIPSTNPSTITKRSPIVSIIQDNLETAGPLSLSVKTLVTQAQGLVTSLGLSNVSDLFPSYEEWKRRIKHTSPVFFEPSLAITNMLGGAVSLVAPVNEAGPGADMRRDLDGFSIPFRMALYTCELMQYKEIYERLPLVDQVRQRVMLSLMVALARDQMNLNYEGWFWASLQNPEIEDQVQNFVNNALKRMQALVDNAKDWRNLNSTGSSLVANRLYKFYIDHSVGLQAGSYYFSRILSVFFQNLTDMHGWHKEGGDEWLESLGVLKADTENVFSALAVLKGLQQHLAYSQLVKNLTNRLVSDITGMAISNEKTLPKLLLLNACLSIYESNLNPVANNRLVFAVKQITSWMGKPKDVLPEVAAQMCIALQLMFPCIKDVYGPYWATSIKFCISIFTSKAIAKNPTEWIHPIQQACKLFAVMRRLIDGGANDDLKDATDTDPAGHNIADAILGLLSLERPERQTQPWKIVNDLICRMVAGIPESYIRDIDQFYPLIASNFSEIQIAAFRILHRTLPAHQAELSVNVLLDKKDAMLPDELLSLLLDPPKSEDYSDEALAQFPTAIRTYLLAWHLVYDSFSTASHKVRSDYSTQLKSENLVPTLLDFLADILGHAAGDPLKLDRKNFTDEMIREYDVDLADAETDERSLQWLLIHIYYLALEYTPGLVKNWYVDLKSKQTRLAIESWTGKYFSPLVIADTLDDVAKWAESMEEPKDDEKDLQIKISKNMREVYAGYEVDEMMMQIKIYLPLAYPLEGVKVEGINRVAVGEKTWQSWLMTTQGVITFSNGSITDGLIAFRRNVTGALKGQTECAICYSIVSSDKKMPDKRCQTCKHLFHSSCLFKWFASSNQSTCPLCRNPFNYGTDADRRGRRRGGPEE